MPNNKQNRLPSKPVVELQKIKLISTKNINKATIYLFLLYIQMLKH